MIQNLEQHYKVLGLEPGASLEEVNQAYKDLVFIWHPDRVPQENERLIQKSVEKLQQINEARDSLRSYHRQYPKTASQNTVNRPSNPYPRRDYSRASSSYQSSSYSSQTERDHRQQQATESNRDRRQAYYQQSSYQTKQPWDYRAYYSTPSQDRDRPGTSRDGYRDFRESDRSSGTNGQTASNYQRPYNKDLRGADLSRSNFKERDFSGRDLSQADLSYSDLSDTFLHKIVLEEANLQGANLKGANLLQANLRNANLREANLIGADLSGSDLSGADLTGAKVGFNNKIMVKITAVKLTGATLPDGSIHP